MAPGGKEGLAFDFALIRWGGDRLAKESERWLVQAVLLL